MSFQNNKRVSAGDVSEGKRTAMVESYTSQVPSGFFLGAALVSMAASLCCKAMRKDHEALFIGQWAAPFLILGLYNKLVKQHGSDGSTTAKIFEQLG